MSLAVAIIADDLTGALDSATTFALRGHRVAVAIGPEHAAAALDSGASVVAVNAASRHLAPAQAATIVRDCAARLAAAGPMIAFKKLDSRLRGNVAAELDAAMQGFACSRAIVAPSVPEEGRTVTAGVIQGKGVAESIAIAPRLGALAARSEIPDAVDQAALARLAARIIAATGVLAVGARGLAQAIAAVLPAGSRIAGESYQAKRPILFVIGSRDPITLAEIDHLLKAHPETAVTLAPNGALPPPSGSLPGISLIRAVAGAAELAELIVVQRLATGVAERLCHVLPATLVLSGGDTALAVLRDLQTKVIFPRGEVAGSIPWFEIAPFSGKSMIILTKSGGFGTPETLVQLLGDSDTPQSRMDGDRTILPACQATTAESSKFETR